MAERHILLVFAGKGVNVHYVQGHVGTRELTSALGNIARRYTIELDPSEVRYLDGDGIEITLENIAVHEVSPVFVRGVFPSPVDPVPTRAALSLQSVEDLYVNDRGKVMIENPAARPKFVAPKATAVDRPRSQLEFVQMMSANKDPLCRGSAPFPEIDISELARHNTMDDAWIALNGKVYDMTKYVSCHPGGRVIMQAAGKDGTELYRKFHPWVNAEALIGKLQVGTLAVNRSRSKLLVP